MHIKLCWPEIHVWCDFGQNRFSGLEAIELATEHGNTEIHFVKAPFVFTETQN